MSLKKIASSFSFDRDMALSLRKASRSGRKRPRGRNRRAPAKLELPRYIRAQSLAKKLNTTLLQFTKKGSMLFDWWPSTPQRSQKKSGFTDVKAIIVNFDEATEICRAFDCESELLDMNLENKDESHEPLLRPRPCIVSVLGHVDHGKTTLMDALRNSSIALHEVGGITQETYCFNIGVDDMSVTFLDTPGHHIFTNMRDNAAFISDLALLIVDVENGLGPQTYESIALAVEHGIPLQPVISKVDDGLCNDSVRKDIAELSANICHEIRNIATKQFPDYPQGLLGDNNLEPLPVSAQTGWNMDTFRKRVTERLAGMSRKGDEKALPYGAVVEGFRENRGRGDVVTVILWRGRLRTGDYFVGGTCSGRVKQLMVGESVVNDVGPGIPVQVMGLRSLPQPGEDFMVFDKDTTMMIAEERRCETEYPHQPRFSNDDIEEETYSEHRSGSVGGENYENLEERNEDKINSSKKAKGGSGTQKDPYLIVIKTDRESALQPLLAACESPFPHIKGKGEIHVRVIEAGVGAVKKREALLADAAGASIQCFRTKSPSKPTKDVIDRLGIEMNAFDVYFDFLKNLDCEVE
mmetsp:Transcript_7961/g.12023  ORF Transcript_7961/g.12023 Transcript_7961/m.12023 type:complete len:580 (+) Transcript_7961:91-1830(+)